MQNLDDLTPVAVNMESYLSRCLRAVEGMARECGLDPKGEAARFQACMEQLQQPYGEESEAANLLEQVQRQVMGTLPNIVEFVLTFSHGTFQGLGYLTQGRAWSTLPKSLSALLANTFRLYLNNGGTQENALLLADLFALSFPRLDALESHAAMAQGMLVGMAPREEGLGFKVYFNTRLGVGAPHRERVSGMLERLGVDGMEFYERLYGESSGASFCGVGVDLFQEQPPRVKLYVRMDRARVVGELPRVLVGMAEEELHQAQEACGQFLGALEDSLLADEVELAIGLVEGRSPTLKFTAFFVSGEGDLSGDIGAKIGAYLDRVGYDRGVFDRTVAEMIRGVESASVERHPWHGVGLEIPVGEVPKVNVYLRPIV